MIQAFVNLFKIPDLKKKILFTLGLIAVFRIGAFVPTPGIDGAKLMQFFDNIARTRGGTLFGIINRFSGGALTGLPYFALAVVAPEVTGVSTGVILIFFTAAG